MSCATLTPEEYLEKHHVKELFINIVKGLLEKRPENVEQHIIEMLQNTLKPQKEREQFPSLLGEKSATVSSAVPNAQNIAVGRRQSAITQRDLSSTSFHRRKAFSSKVTTNTVAHYSVHPKEADVVNHLNSIMQKIPLMQHLDEAQRIFLIDNFFEMKFSANDTIIQQGAAPDNLYIIESGVCSVFKTVDGLTNKVATLKEGHYFGELAIINGTTRAASVIAEEQVTVWALEISVYQGFLKDLNLKKRHRYKESIKQVGFLNSIDDYNQLLIIDALKSKITTPGEVIIKQGEENSDQFYIILEGECKVYKTISGVEEYIGPLKTGDYFGELALITNQPRAATVISNSKCELISLDRESFNRLLGPCMTKFKENFLSYGIQVNH